MDVSTVRTKSSPKKYITSNTNTAPNASPRYHDSLAFTLERVVRDCPAIGTGFSCFLPDAFSFVAFSFVAFIDFSFLGLGSGYKKSTKNRGRKCVN
ncbi:hypothetical protein B0H12DRAFT_1143730 [Mycena haematopus]|nr:hypothetical protein B0H12DRAFT_1143730 [Mycena haematopus]